MEHSGACTNGNIGLLTSRIRAGNDVIVVEKPKKRGNQRKKYDFVWNNYPVEQMEQLGRFLEGLCCKFYFKEEDAGTPHLQGCLWLKKRMRMTELVAMNELSECSFRECRNWDCLVNYCMKDETSIPGGRFFSKGLKLPRKKIEILKEEELYEWEKWVIDVMSTKASNRTIHWLWEPVGEVGKSTFCKYLCVKYGALLLSGKANDMKYGIVNAIKNGGDYPEIILLDIPRTSENFLSYAGIEEIKNGCFFSGKYEGSMVLGNCPHLFCFANFKPDVTKMSLDRWQIKYLGKNEDLDDLDANSVESWF